MRKPLIFKTRNELSPEDTPAFMLWGLATLASPPCKILDVAGRAYYGMKSLSN